MFSGIIRGIYSVVKADIIDSGLSLVLNFDHKLIPGLEIGASISVNGVCLTVVNYFQGQEQTYSVHFEVVPETLRRTNLSELKVGSLVNIERSLKFGDEVGGHLCSGHVDGLATVTNIEKIGEGAEIDFSVEEVHSKFILEKGYVALNGASLTVAKKLVTGFRVAFIPETLSKTNLGNLVIGSKVNIEIDRATQAIVETVERLTKNSQPLD
jgi:riboflavin synthase